MSSPTDGPLDPFGDGLPHGGAGGKLFELWTKPIQPLVPEVRDALRKPLAEVTLHEVLAVMATFGYLIASMALIEGMALNLARVAIRGR
jgi:hypothetical protein